MAFSSRRWAVGLVSAALFAQAAGAQAVLLQIRPRVGDTLRMHLSQTVEMAGTTRDQRGDKPSTMTTSVEVFTRAIAQQWTSGGTLMQTITDSVAMTPTTPGSLAELRRRAMQAKPVWLRVSTDGAMEMVDDGDPHSELRQLFGEMPAMLARTAVSVGESWTREMQIPLSSEPGAMGSVRATFRLDSLRRNGDIAYISMRGVLAHDHRDGSLSELSGSLRGTMQLDRRLAWITDTHAIIDATSTVQPPEGGAPMVVHTRVTQQLKAYRLR